MIDSRLSYSSEEEWQEEEEARSLCIVSIFE